jgi:transposase
MPKHHSKTRSTQVIPEPALEKLTRRRFSSELKLRVIAEADTCKYDELSALLQRENLYSKQLSDWL